MNNYTILRSYNNLIDAEIDLVRLKDEELDVHMYDNNMANLMPHYALAVGGIKIYIHEDDFEKGFEVISFDGNKENDVDEIFNIETDKSNLVCPRCDSANIFEERSKILGILFFISLGVPFSVGKYIYHCSKCDYRWRKEK